MSKYSEQEKLQAVNYYLNGHSFLRTEKHLGIGQSNKEWVRLYNKYGIEGIVKKNLCYTGKTDN